VGEQPIERIRRQPAAEENFDVVDRLVTIRAPGAAARIASRSRDR